MIAVSQYYLKTFKPALNALLTRIFFRGPQLAIGKLFRADSIPRIIVDREAKIVIGDNVDFKRNVELRCHGTARIIIGNNCRIDRGVRILAANNAVVKIDQGTRIGLYSVLNGGDSISVGKKCLLSGFVYLQTSMHGFANKDILVQDQGYIHAPVTLEDDTWLGTHVVILPGVTVSQGGVVGSNAVVNKNVDAYQVVGGVPAKTLKERL